ncbi:hypothetical protein M2405_004254 [Rhodococcus erythropolis]|nr:hypothetical protein [Rhodococcus erythropolis]MCW2425468.1 hypothetical protein [Rhodococcus erythropolis]
MIRSSGNLELWPATARAGEPPPRHPLLRPIDRRCSREHQYLLPGVLDEIQPWVRTDHIRDHSGYRESEIGVYVTRMRMHWRAPRSAPSGSQSCDARSAVKLPHGSIEHGHSRSHTSPGYSAVASRLGGSARPRRCRYIRPRTDVHQISDVGDSSSAREFDVALSRLDLLCRSDPGCHSHDLLAHLKRPSRIMAPHRVRTIPHISEQNRRGGTVRCRRIGRRKNIRRGGVVKRVQVQSLDEPTW